MDRNYGIQLYGLRDRTADDLNGVLRDVARMGYRMVEFAGFFGHSPQDVVAMLQESNLAIAGTHAGIGDLLTDYDKTIAYHKAIGNRRYIIPGHDLRTRAKLDQFIADVNRLQPLMEKEGIRLAYHNHDHEFAPNEDGAVVFDALLRETRLFIQLDTYWAYVGHQDVLKRMADLGDRLICIHLKDGTADGHGLPLGRGTAPVRPVHDWALSRHIPIVVESETLKPNGTAEAQACMDYLKALA